MLEVWSLLWRRNLTKEWQLNQKLVLSVNMMEPAIAEQLGTDLKYS